MKLFFASMLFVSGSVAAALLDFAPGRRSPDSGEWCKERPSFMALRDAHEAAQEQRRKYRAKEKQRARLNNRRSYESWLNTVMVDAETQTDDQQGKYSQKSRKTQCGESTLPPIVIPRVQYMEPEVAATLVSSRSARRRQRQMRARVAACNAVALGRPVVTERERIACRKMK